MAFAQVNSGSTMTQTYRLTVQVYRVQYVYEQVPVYETVG